MPQSSTGPRSVVQHWQTRDVDEAAAGLSQRFAHATRFRYDGRRDAFRLQCSVAMLENARIIRATNTGYQIDGHLEDVVFIAFSTEGGVVLDHAGERHGSLPHARAVALKPGPSFSYAVPKGVTVLGLQIPLSALTRQADCLFGHRHSFDGASEMATSIDVASGPGAALFRNVASAYREIEALEQAGLGLLARTSLDELICNLALIALVPSVGAGMSEPNPVGSTTIERARQYIDAHAEGPIRMGELAHDLGISLRALQVGFQRYVQRSPTGYLFDRRLRNARERLLNTRDGTTVAAVAMECGFVNLGAFSARYRNAFGELPSETLSRRRRVR